MKPKYLIWPRKEVEVKNPLTVEQILRHTLKEEK